MAGRLAALLLIPRPYRHPHPGLAGGLLSRLPFPLLESEVADVVYLSWLVEVETVQTLVPAGMRLWERGAGRLSPS